MRGRVVLFIAVGFLALGQGALVSQAVAQASDKGEVTGSAACCVGDRGNVNMVGVIDLSDLALLIDGLYVSFAPFPCPEEANVNADSSGVVDMGDIYSLTAYLFSGSEIASCGQLRSIGGLDHGARDSVYLSPQSLIVDSLGVAHLGVGVYLFNDADSIAAVSCGFSWSYSSAMTLDTVIGTLDYWDEDLGGGRFNVVHEFYKKHNRAVSNADRQFLVAGSTSRPPSTGGLRPSATPYLLATYYFTLQNWTPSSKVCFELSEFNAGAAAQFVKFDQTMYRPRVSGLVTVRDPGYINTPPTLNPNSNQTVSENQQLVFGISAFDVDGDCLKLSVANLPTGASLVDTGNGMGYVIWAPSCTQEGTYPLVVSVSDGTASVSDSVVVTVLPVLCSPEVSLGPAPIFVEGRADSILITATSPEGFCVQFDGVSMPLGSYFSLNACQRATFFWRPSLGQAGTYHVGIIGDYSFMGHTRRPDAPDTQFVDITVIIDSSNSPIQVSPSSVNFESYEGGPAPSGKWLQVTGPPGKNWLASGGGAWTDLNHNFGPLPDSVVLSVDPSGLPVGVYFDSLRFEVDDSTGSNFRFVRVSLTVNSLPQFTLSPSTVNFSCKIGEDGMLSQRIIIGGDAGLHWSVATLPPWMYFSRNNGTIPDTIFAYQLGCTNQLTPGGEFAEIPFIATDSIVSLFDTLTVTWNILDGVFFDVQPDVVPTFVYTKGGPIPPAWPIEIQSPNGFPYPWHVSAKPSWIAVQPDTGHLPEGQNPPRSALVSIVDSGLLPGSVYEGTVVFTAENLPLYGSQSIRVTVVVDSSIELGLSQDQLGFFHEVGKALPPAQKVVISGPTGTGWSLRKAGPWLAVNKSSGVLPDTIEVTTPGAAELDSGVYLGSIAISSLDSSAAAKSIDVSLHVSPAVEIGSSALRAGQVDSIPIYISHDTIAGFFIPLSYAKSTPLFRSPNSAGIHFDSIRIEQYYLDLGTTYEIDSGNQVIIVQCPARKPPIQPPDTGKSTKLAEMYFSVDSGTASSIVMLDTISTACPPWDETGGTSCGILYYREDGTTFVPQFEGGQIIIISDVAPPGVTGQLVCSPDAVIFGPPGNGDSAYLVIDCIGADTMSFDLSGLSCFRASLTSGVTPAEVWITGDRCSEAEALHISSPNSAAPVDIPVIGSLDVLPILFRPGWNLVSWNIGSAVESVEKIFGPHLSCIDVILSYDEGGLTYDPAMPDFSTLRQVGVKFGYWVKVKPFCSFTITFVGKSVEVTQPIPLHEGYNLAGYLPTMPLDVETALGSVISVLDLAYTFDGGIELYRPGMDSFNSLTTMKAGNGYWLKLSRDATLTYPENVSAVPMAAFARSVAGGSSLAVKATGDGPPMWINLYSRDLMLDGKSVGAGHSVTAHDSKSGAEIGRATTVEAGRLSFMPVYGTPGMKFVVAVDGRADTSRYVWSELGDRIEVRALGSGTSSGSELPLSYTLGQNHPNPFNLSTTISFDVPTKSRVKIEVFDVLGRKVSTLVNGEIEAGSHTVSWEGRNEHGDELASGVYFVRMATDEFVGARKMVLLK